MNWPRSSADFFEAKYRADRDPWKFSSSVSEDARYAATIAALSKQRYVHGFEPGCSVGVLTARLAEICECVTAFDFSMTAAEEASQRCADLPNVRVFCASLIEVMPDATVDLLVLSEVGYYFTREEWRGIVDKMVRCCAAGCTVIAVHWLGTSEDHCMDGDEVHAVLREQGDLRLRHEERHESYRLDRFVVERS